MSPAPLDPSGTASRPREPVTGPPPDDFDAGPQASGDAAVLIVDLDGFEGPLDLLLALARAQKVDLLRISILDLARQYLAFVDRVRAARIDLAADHLVMAAWLAFLKSRLLLPPDPEAPGPSAEEMAAHLTRQLERLDAMRRAGADLMARERLGTGRFARGMPEAPARSHGVSWQVGLMDVMQAYARLRTRDEFRPFAFDRRDVLSMEQVLDRLRDQVDGAAEWIELADLLPPEWRAGAARRRSATAATFAASLELARQGRIEIGQNGVFAPVRVRRAAPASACR